MRKCEVILTPALSPDERRQLINGVKGVTEALENAAVAHLRDLAHTPQLLNVAATLPGKGLQNLLQGAATLRVPPPVFIGIVSYLASRDDCLSDPLNGIIPCVPFPKEVKDKNLTQFTLILTRLAAGTGRVTSNVHGNVFQLTMLAYKHFQYETKLSDVRPVEQELLVPLVIFDKQKRYVFGRRVDIVLDKKAIEDSNDTEKKQAIWVEVKSLIHRQTTARHWTVAKGRTHSHRQFSLDCLAKENKNAQLRINSNFEWWLQSFPTGRPGVARGPDKARVKEFAKKVHRMPKDANPDSFGKSSPNASICTDQEPGLFTLQSIFLGNLLSGMNVDLDLLL